MKKNKILGLNLNLLVLGSVYCSAVYGDISSEVRNLDQSIWIGKQGILSQSHLLELDKREEKSLSSSQFFKVEDLNYSKIFEHHKSEQIKYAYKQTEVVVDIPQALEKLQEMVLDKTILEQLALSLNKKVSHAQGAYSLYQESLSQLPSKISLEDRRNKKKVFATQLQEKLQAALGSLREEFIALCKKNGEENLNCFENPQLYTNKVILFLKDKQKDLEKSNDKNLYHLASQVMSENEKLGLQNYLVEEVLLRGTPYGKKEFAGLILVNRQTNQVLILTANREGNIFSSPGGFNGNKDSNAGLYGRRDLLEQYAGINYKILGAMQRVLGTDPEKKWDIKTVGESNGAALALQAGYHIKKYYNRQLNDKVQVSVQQYDAKNVYVASSAAVVENVLGRENIENVKKGTKPLSFKEKIRNFYDKYFLQLGDVGQETTLLKEEVESVTPTPVTEAPGLLSRAVSTIKGWFGF